MNKREWIICLLLFHTFFLCGQKVLKPDTALLNKIFSESNEIELTPEAKEAIRKGTLISPGFKVPELRQKDKPNSLFMPEIELPEERHWELNPERMPSYVFWLYDEHSGDSTDIRSFVIDEEMMELIRNLYPGIRLRSFALYTMDRTMMLPGITFFFNAEDILRTVFWPTHRAKKRNAKHANAWKHYNMLPMTGK